jgi:F-box and WD-40 domain protein CDC4
MYTTLKRCSRVNVEDRNARGAYQHYIGPTFFLVFIMSLSPTHHSFPAHGSNIITCLVLAQDRVISASDDLTILVYDLLARKLLHSLQGHEGGVWALAVARDILVSGSSDRTVRVWDLTDGRCTHVFGGHTSTVRCLAIVQPEWVEMEDGRREKWPTRALIVTGSRDRTVRVWALPRSGDAGYSCLDEGDPEVRSRFCLAVLGWC